MQDLEKNSGIREVPVFPSTYSAEHNKVKSIVEHCLPILLNDDIYAQILDKYIRTMSHRAPILGSYLLLSLFTTKKKGPVNWLHFKGNYRCNDNK